MRQAFIASTLGALLMMGCSTSSNGLNTTNGKGGAGGTGGASGKGGAGGTGGKGGSSGVSGTGGANGKGGVSGAGGADSKGGSSGTSTTADLCSGRSPIVTIPGTTATTSVQTCTGRIAETHFVNALCTCENASVAGYLKTRSFDSTKSTTPDLGGSVGINQTYLNSAGFTDVGGSLSIAGSESLSLAGYVKTGGDFRTQGSATVAGYTNVGRNMWLGNGLTDLGPVTVTGDLHGAGAIVAIPLLVSGKSYQESVAVPPPCPSGASDILNVAALVADAKVHNDNAKNGITPTMFNVLVGNIETTLPCGKFYIEQIAGIGNVIFNVTGRVALFVDGSIANTGNLEFRLSPTAEIDIFVRDNLMLTGRATFGQKDRPAASRVYVGGEGDVTLTGDGEFVGNVYAPRSRVLAIGYANVLGSVFARNFVSPGYASFTFDLAIKNAGDTCDVPTPPPGTCTLCGTCASGTACVGGQCGACRTDADCCSQLICTNGQCIQPGIIY
jgi:hypothetical protein